MGSRVRVPYAPQNQEADWLPFFVRTCLSPVPLGVMSEVSARGIDVSAVSDGQSTSLAHHVALRGHKLVTID